ncbi:hypothetical protein [Cellulomonas carbonis]|uniref:Uncharacterized protein n=1 Tax=Cellulomonas carbonis T26 TaxID=947969 RepID=A0A0A0BMR6_9CELL|nr:hypothetical protein [Cellulomonas carbonis]KGM09783.1 hypothetical protein N868_18680 [Cellulomonas carbonis T26]GGC14980.1 hypothetical protein GCM10010972_30310 [Cellulomonas carbonis]
MSTTPGDSTWADAGLVPPDSSAVPGSERTTTPVDPDDLPRAPKPDLLEEASEGDALEQAQDADGDTGDRLPPSAARDDAAEGDVLEQAIEVPDDGTDDYRAP